MALAGDLQTINHKLMPITAAQPPNNRNEVAE